MKAEEVEVYTSWWEGCRDGAKPRGYGHWCFDIGGRGKLYVGPYSRCKAEAQRDAAALGIACITLLP